MIYTYTDQILLSNLSDSNQKCPHFFLTIFSQNIQFNLKFSTLLVFLIWLGNFFQIYISQL